MKLKRLVKESDIFNVGDVIEFLEESGLGEMRVNLMRTYDGQPFISFSISDNEAVKKLTKMIAETLGE